MFLEIWRVMERRCQNVNNVLRDAGMNFLGSCIDCEKTALIDLHAGLKREIIDFFITPNDLGVCMK